MYMVRRSRTPQGVRGLKPFDILNSDGKKLSHSARSAWIETGDMSGVVKVIRVALRKECVD